MRANSIVKLFYLACAVSAGPVTLAQSPQSSNRILPEVVAASTISPTHGAPQHARPTQSSPSDAVVELAETPTLRPEVGGRLTDRDGGHLDQFSMLNTESMIGPMQSAEGLFGRLEIDEGLLDVAELARSGPRVDAENYLWSTATTTWVSPAFHHRPLYFEQPNLERYGIGPARAVQPLLSSVHFFGSIPLVPYKTLTHHPRERVYTLGQNRPGSCVPVQRGVILGTSSVGELSRFWHPGSGY